MRLIISDESGCCYQNSLLRMAYPAQALLLSICAALAVISGCASPSATPVSLDDGQRGHLIVCDGMRLSAIDCIKQANEQCDNDYEVIATTGEWPEGQGVAGVLKHFDRAMVISCLDGG
ncbi:YgdI/YgdR family lipoprotein [Halorhodospira halochloris]|uniref:YgdI/YgdR family lipoprotein n=1 Tax=Halorhodospira halochloris TaxID=1052 RepID=UPI001EE8CFC7|nr:YgdI/YgdR family lipoprotein [Halorhodospira halochloris]MCG5530551.1 YgdI/YgdR family lipoprotein [Halorhodospira halochloris]